MSKKKSFKEDNFGWIVGILVAVVLILIVALIQPSLAKKESGPVKSRQLQLWQKYLNHEISLQTYEDFANKDTYNDMRLGAALALVLAGLGITFHGIKLVHVQNRCSDDEDDDEGHAKK